MGKAQSTSRSAKSSPGPSPGPTSRWFFLLLAGAGLFYMSAMREKGQTLGEMTAKLHELEKSKSQALAVQKDLILQIESEKDPAWVEMVLKRNLGMVREGQVKVYFHTEE